MKNFCLKYLAIQLFFVLAFFNCAAQNQAPVVSATGNQFYCPGTSLPITTSFSIQPATGGPTTALAVYIQISSGYVNGQDMLSLSSPVTNVTSSWNATAGKLTLTGTGGQEVPFTTFETAVNNVVYHSTAPSPSGTRTFSINLGEANYLPSTQHYYKYIANLGISWTAAKVAAEGTTYYGLQGYLATLLSAEEAQLCGAQATGTGWIGGSDSQTEGVWKWMTGPEAGTVFWNGGVNGSTPNFAFWNTGEPNNQGDEDYAHITAPGVGITGSWNDLPNGGSSGDYVPKGYIVEFGGMPGDPVLHISASTTIIIPKITNTIPATACSGDTVTLQAQTSGTTVYWYDAATGGNLVYTGSSFTTPALTQTTSYYASAYDASCTTATRTMVIATINARPTVTVQTPVNICSGTNPALQATPSAGTVNWYMQATGGSPIGTGTSFSAQPITANTTYYAEALSPEGCTSAARAAVNVTVSPLPTLTVTPPPGLCGPGSVTLQATASGGTINWYSDMAATTLIGSGNSITSPTVSATTTFYAQANTNGCLSAIAPAVVNVSPLPVVNAPATTYYICVEGTATLTVTADSGSTIGWYDAATGGTLLGTGITFTTPYLTQSATYYAEADNGGCISAGRLPMAVIIVPLPTVTAAPAASVCGEGTTQLTATPSAGTINWYDSNDNLIGTGTTITSPTVSTDTTFYAEAVNNGCTSVTKIAVPVTVNPVPDAGPDESLTFCANGSVELDAGVTGVTYLWSNGKTTQTITIRWEGIYTVTVTNGAGCSDSKTFTATTIAAPVIDEVAIYNDAIVIQLTDESIDDTYEYSIDGEHYKASNRFANLPAGMYTAYVRSVNGCGRDSQPFTVNLIPKFFTPNGDNINDEFSIAGINLLPEAEVIIMDRYGKIITGLNRQNHSWDGTYNGRPLPADDYWYIVRTDSKSPEIKGHFSLLR